MAGPASARARWKETAATHAWTGPTTCLPPTPTVARTVHATRTAPTAATRWMAAADVRQMWIHRTAVNVMMGSTMWVQTWVQTSVRTASVTWMGQRLVGRVTSRVGSVTARIMFRVSVRCFTFIPLWCLMFDVTPVVIFLRHLVLFLTSP